MDLEFYLKRFMSGDSIPPQTHHYWDAICGTVRLLVAERQAQAEKLARLEERLAVFEGRELPTETRRTEPQTKETKTRARWRK